MPRQSAPFFRFKRFTVHHDRAALKVCTEACILGASVTMEAAATALDIGTGTGLLALMLSQRHPALQIDAIDIDEESCRQAAENAARSPFGAAVRVYHAALQDWHNDRAKPAYDLIVSNPPFFTNPLRAASDARNRALHTDTLSLPELADCVGRLLAPEGRFAVLLPSRETRLLQDLMRVSGFYPADQLQIFQRWDKPVFRLITTFERRYSEGQTRTLYIHETDGKYTEAFRTLLKEYYLHF